jgi:hypothetical protein
MIFCDVFVLQGTPVHYVMRPRECVELHVILFQIINYVFLDSMTEARRHVQGMCKMHNSIEN